MALPFFMRARFAFRQYISRKGKDRPGVGGATSLVIGVLTGAHIVLVGGGALFLAFPTPWRRLRPPLGTPADDGLEFEEVTLADGCPGWLINKCDAATCSLDSGACPKTVICLCHGRSRNKAWMRPLINFLAPHHSVLAFDFRGHGDNPYGSTTVGVREADTVDYALDLLEKQGFQEIMLYGCSMGGAAALISQGRRPHPCVKGLITDGTFAAFPEIIDAQNQWLPRYLTHSALFLAGRIAQYDPWTLRPIDSVVYVTVPKLFLHGDADRLVPPDSAQRMAQRSATAEAIVYHGRHDEPINYEMMLAVRTFAEKIFI